MCTAPSTTSTPDKPIAAAVVSPPTYDEDGIEVEVLEENDVGPDDSSCTGRGGGESLLGRMTPPVNQPRDRVSMMLTDDDEDMQAVRSSVQFDNFVDIEDEEDRGNHHEEEDERNGHEAAKEEEEDGERIQQQERHRGTGKSRRPLRILPEAPPTFTKSACPTGAEGQGAEAGDAPEGSLLPFKLDEAFDYDSAHGVRGVSSRMQERQS